MRPALARELQKAAVVVVIMALAPIPVLGSTYYQGILTRILLFAVFAVALNIVFGHTDQLFLFVGGLGGLGAYTTALLTDWTGVTAWATLVAAALFCGLIGLLVSWVSAKRRFTVILIAILTLNLQLVLSEAFVGARDLTGGSTGFPYEYFTLEVAAGLLGIPAKMVLYYLLLGLFVLSLAIYLGLIHSKFGIAFEAIREDETAAASIGIDVVRYKAVAGFVAAALIGVVGAFHAREAAYITPSIFTFISVDVVVLVVLIIGGLRTTLGPLVGAAIVLVIQEALAAFTQWRTAIFGALLIVLFLYFRNGVITFFQDRLGRIHGRLEGISD